LFRQGVPPDVLFPPTDPQGAARSWMGRTYLKLRFPPF
jgi:hypothetical protein